MYLRQYLLVSTVHTYANTEALWLSQRPEFEALVLFHCWCAVAVVVVRTVPARLTSSY